MNSQTSFRVDMATAVTKLGQLTPKLEAAKRSLAETAVVAVV